MQHIFRRLLQFLSPSSHSRGTPRQEADTLGLAAPATAEDVANCYLLILGREHESDAVIAEKTGMNRATLICAFLSSEEFGADIRPFLEGRKEANLFRAAVSGDLRHWAARLFLPNEDPRTLAELQDPAPLLAHCLRRPPLAQLCDACLGEGEAEAIAAYAAKMGKPRLKASTTSEDVKNCYLLFLQRSPESAGVMAARPDTPLAEAACDFIDSPEFASQVAYPAMDGRFLKTHLSDDVRAWAASALHIENADTLSFAALVAAALEQPAVAYTLGSRKLRWGIDEVARGLRAAAGGRRSRLASVQDRLREVSHNVEVLDSNHMKLARGGHMIRFSGADPWIMLRPVGPAIEGDLLAVRFRATLEGMPNVGQLYFNYGEGFTEAGAIPLVPDLEGFHRAVIAAPRNLIALRWDPAGSRGLASISLIEATPLSAEAYCAEHLGEENTASFLQRLAAEAALQPAAPFATALSQMLSPAAEISPYAQWIMRNEPGRDIFEQRYQALTERPLISIIVPVYNPPAAALSAMIASVGEQVYQEWELCLADDASTLPHVREIIDRAASDDSRIKVVHRPINGHICRASNSAFELSTGSWIAMLDHDDTLAPQALLAVAEHIAEHPSAGLIYSDEDKIDEFGKRYDPYFKPDYSPELLLAQNYVSHLTAIRADLVRKANGWRTGFEGSQDHDLVLRIIETLELRQIGHIPQILYHWRALAGSTALENSEKNYALHAGEAAVRDHLSRTAPEATVEIIQGIHHYRVRHHLPDDRPLVSLIIPTRDKADVLKVAIDSILDKSTYENYEILIIDNGSVESETLKYFKHLSKHDNIRIIEYPHAFNYSKINNFGVERANGSIIALVNNDIEVITPDWMEEMISWVIKKEIGCVGAKLYYPDMTIQHAGVIIGLGGVAGHSHKYFPREAPGYFHRLQIHQNLSAVTAACLFVRREVFDEVGGLEEKLSVAFNDVDFCLRIREAGYRNLFTPFAELFHHESISRGMEDTPEKIARFAKEVDFMKSRWRNELQRDPFYSPNLTLDREDFGINI